MAGITMNDLNPDDLRQLVDEEIERAAIRELVREATEKPKPLLDRVFRHPLFITFVGFMLTSGLLWVVQQWVDDTEKERAARAETRAKIAADAKEAIDLLDGLVLLAHQRATETSLITFSLLDGDGELTQDRVGRYYEIYRRWVTTYQPQTRKILAHMGVSGQADATENDPFFRAIEDKLGYESFLLGHACLRRLLVVADEENFARYTNWWTDQRPKFTCPRDADSPLTTAPISFLRARYRAARACATEIFFYARIRIRAYEAARLARVDDPNASFTLPDPQASYPVACQVS